MDTGTLERIMTALDANEFNYGATDWKKAAEEYPEIFYIDASNGSYQSKLLLIEESDGGISLGFLVGSGEQAYFVNKKHEQLRAMSWAYVHHSSYYVS